VPVPSVPPHGNKPKSADYGAPPGRRTVNTEPLPCSLATVTSPPNHARELAGDCKPEARAAETLPGRPVGLSELLEQLRLLLRRHANAAISHGKLNPVAPVSRPARPQRDLAVFGELTGVAEQVEQNLLKD